MKRRISAIAIPILVLGTFAWVYAQTTPSRDAGGGDKLVTKSGLTIITLKKGEPTQTGDTISVIYTGRLPDGTVFDSSAMHGNQPIQVPLGANPPKVIKGWEEGLLGMHLYDKRKLIVPPDLAYGAAGRQPVIPPNATLEFEIECVGILKAAP